MVSVIIPARDAAGNLARQLDAVAPQLGSDDAELVVVDNCSSDGTAAVAEARGARVVAAHGRASPGFARNAGAAAARHPRLLFCDADDRVGDGWVQGHVRALEDFDVVVGATDGERPEQPLQSVHSYRPGGGAGNLSIRRSAFEALGGFDPSLQAGEDLDLCWRAHEAGFSIGFAPAAVVTVAPRTSARQALRQGFRNGRADVELYRRHRSSGMRRRATHRALRSWLWLVRHARMLGRPDHRIGWAFRLGIQLGRLVASVRTRTLYL